MRFKFKPLICRTIAFAFILQLQIQSFLNAQKITSLEIQAIAQHDSYNPFEYPTGGIYNDRILLKGTSPGLNVLLTCRVAKKYLLQFGLGYSHYNFNNIDHYSKPFDRHYPSRNILYDSPDLFQFATNGYAYNCLTLPVGLSKEFNYKCWSFRTGIQIINYLTFSERYKIGTGTVGASNQNWTQHKIKYFGFNARVELAVLKTLKHIKVGPLFGFPIFTSWNGDDVFREESFQTNRTKWIKGYAIGIKVAIPLNIKP